MANITATHLEDLERSGIPYEVAEMAGIESMTSTEIGRACFGPGSTAPSDGYVIPYKDGYRRYRIIGGDKGTPKYLSAGGDHWSLYVPFNFPEALEGSYGDCLVVTEGEKKALAGCMAGVPTVAVSGVTTWHDPANPRPEGARLNAGTPVLPALLEVTEGKRVLVLGDSDLDASGKETALASFKRLAQALSHQAQAVAVNFALCPAASDGSKQGLDDWLQAAGDTPVKGWLDEVKAFVKPGIRIAVPYSRDNNGDPLYYLIPFSIRGDFGLPKVLKQQVGEDGETRETIPTKAPYVWLSRNMLLIERNANGVFDSRDPAFPPQVYTELEGETTDGRTIRPIIEPDELEDCKRLRSLGFPGSPAEGQRVWDLQRGSVPTAYVIDGAGWVQVDGERHYIYGKAGRVELDGNKLEVIPKAGAATGSGSPINGSFEINHRAITALVKTQPVIAALLGFAVSGMANHFATGSEPGLIHLHGGTGRGKTTVTQAVASLAGKGAGPRDKDSWLMQWRTTDNGLEHPLARRHHAFAVFDEVSQAPASMDWSNVAYMIANGRGRQRMSASIREREPLTWETQVISTGEESFMGKVRKSARSIPHGLEFRVVDLPLDSLDLIDLGAMTAEEWGHALSCSFDGLEGNALNQAIVQRIGEIAANHYGHLWPELVRAVHHDGGALYSEQYKAEVNHAIGRTPAEANSPRRRRTKHAGSCMAGLRLLCRVLGIDDKQGDYLDNAREFVNGTLLSAGMESETDSGSTTTTERLISEVFARRASFDDGIRAAQSREGGSWGWIDEEGNVALYTPGGLTHLCNATGIDERVALKALTDNGWEKVRKRPPRAGRSANPRMVLFAKGLFEAATSYDPEPEDDDGITQGEV